MKKLQNYLRASRKNMGLTQNELSFLLGKTSVSAISKFENSKTLPDLKTTLQFRVLYGSNLKNIWPRKYAQCEYLLIERLNMLIEVLLESNEHKDKTKAKWLKEVVARIINNNK